MEQKTFEVALSDAGLSKESIDILVTNGFVNTLSLSHCTDDQYANIGLQLGQVALIKQAFGAKISSMQELSTAVKQELSTAVKQELSTAVKQELSTTVKQEFSTTMTMFKQELDITVSKVKQEFQTTVAQMNPKLNASVKTDVDSKEQNQNLNRANYSLAKTAFQQADTQIRPPVTCINDYTNFISIVLNVFHITIKIWFWPSQKRIIIFSILLILIAMFVTWRVCRTQQFNVKICLCILLIIIIVFSIYISLYYNFFL